MQNDGFIVKVLSDRFGPSSIRLCLFLTVILCMYAVGIDVTATHHLTTASTSILLALIGLFSGGYYVSKSNEKQIVLAQQSQVSDPSKVSGDDTNGDGQ